MTAARYEVVINEASHLVRHTADGRVLGAYGTSFWRSWVYPLYTPSGRTVVENSPFDHPFHNGIFVGQNPVKVGGLDGNLWALPVKRSHDDHIMVRIGRMDPQGQPTAEVTDAGVRFALDSTWCDENEGPLVDERRTVAFRALADATVCDVTSRKTAAYGAAEFPQTKFGCIGARVEPCLLPRLGGVIIADDGRRGTAELVDAQRESEFVAYENILAGHTFGLFLHILDPGVRGPWFIRDYGMAMYNQTWEQSVAVPAGEAWTVSLRAVAYDGALTPERVDEWCAP